MEEGTGFKLIVLTEEGDRVMPGYYESADFVIARREKINAAFKALNLAMTARVGGPYLPEDYS